MIKKDFEYYLEMARGPVRYKFADESSIELIDNVEKIIDYRLEVLDNANDTDKVEFDLIQAIKKDEFFHDEAKGFSKEDLEDVVQKLMPKYEGLGWRYVEFKYPKIRFIK